MQAPCKNNFYGRVLSGPRAFVLSWRLRDAHSFTKLHHLLLENSCVFLISFFVAMAAPKVAWRLMVVCRGKQVEGVHQECGSSTCFTKFCSRRVCGLFLVKSARTNTFQTHQEQHRPTSCLKLPWKAADSREWQRHGDGILQ